MNPIRLFMAQEGLCFHCGEEMLMRPAIRCSKRDRGYTQEHIIPRSKGGRARHIVLAHGTCNTWRGNALPDDAMLHRLAEVRARAEQIPIREVKRSLSNDGKNATRAAFARERTRPLLFDPPRMATRFDCAYSAADAATHYVDGK